MTIHGFDEDHPGEGQVELIAEHFDLRKNQISIKRGASGRVKLVQIDG